MPYTVKIIAAGELPKGGVAWLVAGYGIKGAAIFMTLYPLLGNRDTLIGWFGRYFFVLLIVPMILLAVSAFTRIYDYGVTEDRYLVVLFWLWLVACAAFALLRRPGLLLVMYASAALLLLAASFGPWGAVELSTRSQIGRLERLLEKHRVLQNLMPSPGKTLLQTDNKDVLPSSSTL